MNNTVQTVWWRGEKNSLGGHAAAHLLYEVRILGGNITVADFAKSLAVYCASKKKSENGTEMFLFFSQVLSASLIVWGQSIKSVLAEWARGHLASI